MPHFFRRTSPKAGDEGKPPSDSDEDSVDVTDRSTLNGRASRLLDSEMMAGEHVQAIVPARGNAIVALDNRILVLHTGLGRKSVAHSWDMSAITAVYTNGLEVALYGPSLEAADNVWLPGESTRAVPLNSAANAIQLWFRKEAAVETMRDLLPQRQDPDWDELRSRAKARANVAKVHAMAVEAEERAAELAETARKAFVQSGLSRELFSEFQAEVRPMRLSGIDGKDLLALYRSIHAGDVVIVRKYVQLRGGAKGGTRAFEAEANLLARHGYAATTQGFAANNALTGISVGSGEIIVSYAKQSTWLRT